MDSAPSSGPPSDPLHVITNTFRLARRAGRTVEEAQAEAAEIAERIARQHREAA